MMKIGKTVKDEYSGSKLRVVDSCEGFMVVLDWTHSALLIVDDGSGVIRSNETIAECHDGDFEGRYGDIVGWLKKVSSRQQRRIDDIDEQIRSLEEEEKGLKALKEELAEFISNVDAL